MTDKLVKKEISSPLSNFVRNMSQKDKEKLYKKAIAAASVSQLMVIEKANSIATY